MAASCSRPCHQLAQRKHQLAQRKHQLAQRKHVGIRIARLHKNRAYIQIQLEAWIFNEVRRTSGPTPAASGPDPAQHLIPETAKDAMQRELEAEMLLV